MFPSDFTEIREVRWMKRFSFVQITQYIVQMHDAPVSLPLDSPFSVSFSPNARFILSPVFDVVVSVHAK